ncbi:MAG: hypothetical protein AB7R55_01905 [Gemmatimonadales bacterium]
MSTKQAMLEELRATEVLRPTLLARALEANDAAKYCLSLLQSAVRLADHPDEDVPSLRRERELARVDAAELDQVIAGTRREGDHYRVPHLGRVTELLGRSVDAMLAPLRGDDRDPTVAELEARRDRLAPLWGDRPDDALDRATLDRLTSGSRDAGDTVHLLVMDLHRALNGLHQAISTESVAGARVLGVANELRPLIEAFMRGLHRTEALRFDHPGLGTTATQVGERLVIQNDIGTSDVHLLLVGVEDGVATVSYSDLHPPRLRFFKRLLEPFEVSWGETTGGELAAAHEDGAYELAVGSYRSETPSDLEQFLEHLGSRLVFLIDWNKARKRLRRFVSKSRAIALLDWAARNEIGHMGWLVMGGERLVFESLESSRFPIRLGEELHEILGRDSAVDYLEFVLRACSEGLRRGRSDFLIRDEIRSELGRHLRGARQTLLSLAGDHGTIAVDLVTLLRESLPDALRGEAGVGSRLAERGRRWEHEADGLLNQARALAERWPEGAKVAELLSLADDVVDALEEAAFLSTLIRTPAESELAAAVVELCEVAVGGTREYRKALELARVLSLGAGRQDWADFSEAIDAVLAAEHRGDEALRRVKLAQLSASDDVRQFQVLNDLARSLEKATDALMHVSLALRTQLLSGADR